MKTNLRQTVVVKFNGLDVEIKTNERGLISVCSHWELIWGMKAVGLVELVEGELFRLVKPLSDAIANGSPVWQVGQSFVNCHCDVEGGRLVA